ncbi:MAG: hypothetical protein HS104_34905 [Polyangiaceae bacterium]|nr:hypothetical protein [Polyangiaceae bacterium]MCL4752435.1 hypothetical protein [Myxococcales bacterium]
MRGILLGLLVGLGAAVACGGSTSSDGKSGGAGGSGGATTGGTSSGGSSSGGSSSGGSSAGGTGNVSGLTACSAPGTCELFATNCCGGYCDPNAPLGGFTAVNETKLNEFEAALCPGDIACPGCVSFDNPNYLALCRAGQCTAVNLRDDSLSACQSDSDCRVRWGSDCCEDCGGGNPDQLVAYNKDKSLEAEVCNPNDGACPPCAPPPYPKSILPYCGPDGHCTYTIVGP